MHWGCGDPEYLFEAGDLATKVLVSEAFEGGFTLQGIACPPVAAIKKTEKRYKLLDANGDRGVGGGLVRMEPFQNFA